MYLISQAAVLLKGRWDCGNKEGKAFLWFILNCCNLRENWATETSIYVHIQSPTKSPLGGFPGSSVVKNLPANAGDTGSIPDLGRSHMPQSNKACAPQPLSLCSRARPLQQERPPQWEALEPQLRSSPHSPQLETACAATKTQHSQE